MVTTYSIVLLFILTTVIANCHPADDCGSHSVVPRNQTRGVDCNKELRLFLHYTNETIGTRTGTIGDFGLVRDTQKLVAQTFRAPCSLYWTKRPLLVGNQPLFRASCSLYWTKCPLLVGNQPLFRALCSLYWTKCPLLVGNQPLFRALCSLYWTLSPSFSFDYILIGYNILECSSLKNHEISKSFQWNSRRIKLASSKSTKIIEISKSFQCNFYQIKLAHRSSDLNSFEDF